MNNFSFQVVCDQCDSGLAAFFCHSDGEEGSSLLFCGSSLFPPFSLPLPPPLPSPPLPSGAFLCPTCDAEVHSGKVSGSAARSR